MCYYQYCWNIFHKPALWHIICFNYVEIHTRGSLYYADFFARVFIHRMK
jgi:hypothetical protein